MLHQNPRRSRRLRRESAKRSDNRVCSPRDDSPLRLRSLDHVADDSIDGLLSSGRLSTLFILALGEKAFSLPKSLARHLVDHLDVDDELQKTPRRRRLFVAGGVTDGDVDFVALYSAADDRVRFAFCGVAQPQPIVKAATKSLGQL